MCVLTNCRGFTIERILLIESPSDRPSKSINDNEQLQMLLESQHTDIGNCTMHYTELIQPDCNSLPMRDTLSRYSSWS